MTEDFMTSWAKAEEQRRQNVRNTKDALMPILRENGITYVAIAYNGYGDSGQVEAVSVYGPERTTPPADAFDSLGGIAVPDVVVTLPETDGKRLREFLEDYGWEVAYATNPGFENNDGGQGTVLIDVEDETITIEHGENYTETRYSTHEIE